MNRKLWKAKMFIFLGVGGGNRKNKVVNMQLCLECIIVNLPCYSMLLTHRECQGRGSLRFVFIHLFSALL